MFYDIDSNSDTNSSLDEEDCFDDIHIAPLENSNSGNYLIVNFEFKLLFNDYYLNLLYNFELKI
jgi:hypothetical protein